MGRLSSYTKSFRKHVIPGLKGYWRTLETDKEARQKAGIHGGRFWKMKGLG